MALPHIAHAQASRLTGRISGRVVDEATGIAIVADLALSHGERIVRSDSAGYFLFQGIGPGSYVVRARALGYSSVFVTAALRDVEEAFVTIRLASTTITLRPVQTIARSAERERFDNLPVPGVVSIGTAEFSRLPVTGDGDIVRAASLLPGVSARNDFSAGLNVRGGEADQNLVLLDGIPLYNPFTWVGYSAPSSTLQCGRSMSSRAHSQRSMVVACRDVKSVEDPRPGPRTTADVSMLSSSVMVNGATGDGHISWSVAGRRTYADRLVNALLGSNDFPYHFQDLQLHGRVSLPRGATLALTAYAGLDQLQTTSGIQSAFVPESGVGKIAFDWSNQAVGILFTQLIRQRATFEQRLSVSGFATHFDVPAESLVLAQQLRDLRIAGQVHMTASTHSMAGAMICRGTEPAIASG